MNFDARFAVVILAAFASANVVGSLASIWQWRRVPSPSAPMDRARYLFHLRLLPLVAGLAWSALAMGSFILFEPRGDGERIGTTLPLLSTISVTLGLAALARLAFTLQRHRRVLRTWLRHAQPIPLDGVDIPTLEIESAFPVVAVIGVLRPRLVVARRVLDTCSTDELTAILAHERVHIHRRDNLRRLLLLALPDPLAWLRVGREMDLAWHDAAEQVADEAAGAARGDAGRVALAGALVRLARLVAPGDTLEDIPASALYRGEPLEARVRRLLDPIPPRPRSPRHYQWGALAGVIALAIILLNPIHFLLEAAVTLLP